MEVSYNFLEIFGNAINTINKNGQQFGEIRQNLAAVAKKTRNWGYEIKAGRVFDTMFKDCEKDIEALEQIMQDFVSCLDKKIQRIKELEEFSF